MGDCMDAAARLERDKKIICDGILAEFSDVEAIFLCGGYGRGEGAWIERADGGFDPYNDYDLTVITEKSITPQKLNALRERLAAAVGIRWVDIEVHTKAQLRELKCLIKSVDFICASVCIYGDEDVKRAAPKLDSAKIGFLDIYKLYFTRMWTFLGSYEKNFAFCDEDASMFFKNQMAKAVLAICDVVLIRKHAYVSSYTERVKRVAQLYADEALLVETAQWALREKLRPSGGIMACDDTRELYTRVYELYKKYMYRAFGVRSIFFKTPSLCALYHMFAPRYFSRRIYHRFVRHSHSTRDYVLVNTAQNYIFHAFGCDGAKRNKHIAKCAAILKRVSGEAIPSHDYDFVRLAAARVRNEV